MTSDKDLLKVIYPFKGYTNPYKPDESSRPKEPQKPVWPPAYPKPQTQEQSKPQSTSQNKI